MYGLLQYVQLACLCSNRHHRPSDTYSCVRSWYAGLANKKHFEQPGFVEYLAYLQYWKRPEYAKFVT